MTMTNAELNLVIAERTADMDESTGLSWLWCFLFGPLWFLFIGSGKWALISFIAAIFTIGLSMFVMPFFAYKAHRDVARKNAISITSV